MAHTSWDLTLNRAGSAPRRAIPTFRIVRDAAEMRRIAGTWRRLAVARERPFDHWAWAHAAAESFASANNLHILVIDDGPLAACLPLARRWIGGPHFELLSSRELFEPVDGVYADRPSATGLAEALLSLPLPSVLARMPASSDLIKALSAVAAPGQVTATPAPGSPWLPLDPGWVDPEARFTPRRQRDARRARRLAESLGPIRVEITRPTAAEAGPLLDRAFSVEAAGWKGRAGTALLHDRARGRFFRQYAALAAARSSLVLAFLHIGDRPAAMQLIVEHGGRLWLLKMGYDPAFARCSPGLLLMIDVVRHAAARGLAAYEFLGVEEPWLQPWGAHLRPCTTVRVYPESLPGRCARWIDRWTR